MALIAVTGSLGVTVLSSAGWAQTQANAEATLSNGQLDGLEGLARLLDTGNVYVEQRDRRGNWQTLFRLGCKKKHDKNANSTNANN